LETKEALMACDRLAEIDPNLAPPGSNGLGDWLWCYPDNEYVKRA
jgi:hypothetical protein